ncbi:TPA: filamentous hemagglutinin N-terminal domain-containing protein [Morganella morganii]
MKKNGLLLSILVLSPLSFSLANTTDISIVNNTATLSYGENKKIVTILAKGESNLSHIKYDKFNVGSEGVIFNNQIGADTIINEVTSKSVSELNGEIRIKGKQAKYTLINPNGIVCADACSFRNTLSANLVVGKTMIPGGEIIGNYPGAAKLIIKNTTKRIANRLILDGKHIEINNSAVKADYLQFSNTFNLIHGSPLRNSITVDQQSMIKAKEIKLNIIDTDIANYGIIRGNVSGILLVSDIINEGKISGNNISFTLRDAVNVSGKGKIQFKNGHSF